MRPFLTPYHFIATRTEFLISQSILSILQTLPEDIQDLKRGVTARYYSKEEANFTPRSWFLVLCAVSEAQKHLLNSWNVLFTSKALSVLYVKKISWHLNKEYAGMRKVLNCITRHKLYETISYVPGKRTHVPTVLPYEISFCAQSVVSKIPVFPFMLLKGNPRRNLN